MTCPKQVKDLFIIDASVNLAPHAARISLVDCRINMRTNRNNLVYFFNRQFMVIYLIIKRIRIMNIPVDFCLSEPAKSTKVNFEVLTFFTPPDDSVVVFTVRTKTACDLEDVLFILVAET